MLEPKVIQSNFTISTEKVVEFPNGIKANYILRSKNDAPPVLTELSFIANKKSYSYYANSKNLEVYKDKAINSNKFYDCFEHITNIIKTEEDLLKFEDFDNVFGGIQDIHFYTSITGKVLSSRVNILSSSCSLPHDIRTNDKILKSLIKAINANYKVIEPIKIGLVPYYNQNEKGDLLQFSGGTIEFEEKDFDLFMSTTVSGKQKYFSLIDGFARVFSKALEEISQHTTMQSIPKAIDYASKMTRETALKIYKGETEEHSIDVFSDSSVSDLFDNISWFYNDYTAILNSKTISTYLPIVSQYNFEDYEFPLDLLAFAVLELVYNNGRFLE